VSDDPIRERERPQFEAWLAENVGLHDASVRVPDDRFDKWCDYAQWEVQYMWEAWLQRASLERGE
jgi:hypothetical protein